jgi:hypothetical protein
MIGGPAMAGDAIVHDAECDILEAQHGDVWAADDADVDAKPADFRAQRRQAAQHSVCAG